MAGELERGDKTIEPLSLSLSPTIRLPIRALFSDVLLPQQRLSAATARGEIVVGELFDIDSTTKSLVDRLLCAKK